MPPSFDPIQRLARPRHLARPALPGEFLRIHRLDRLSLDEWMATLPDGTEIVVADVEGKPSPIAIEKAIAVVQSRAYLEARARQLLAPSGRPNGQWRLLTIDFGVEARHRRLEFLMCFAFQATSSDLVAASPYIEIGFALPVRSGTDPMFVLTIQTASGLAG